ncbi:unnamed protein product, partial [Urochloa humidicola]
AAAAVGVVTSPPPHVQQGFLRILPAGPPPIYRNFMGQCPFDEKQQPELDN